MNLNKDFTSRQADSYQDKAKGITNYQNLFTEKMKPINDSHHFLISEFKVYLIHLNII